MRLCVSLYIDTILSPGAIICQKLLSKIKTHDFKSVSRSRVQTQSNFISHTQLGLNARKLGQMCGYANEKARVERLHSSVAGSLLTLCPTDEN